jgi:hypothetical protein
VPNSSPITYTANGKQYVAVTVGNGGAQAMTLLTFRGFPLTRECDSRSQLGRAILIRRELTDAHWRRIGVLKPVDKNDPVAKARISAFTQALAGLGRTEVGRPAPRHHPNSTLVTAAVQRATRTIPIVFARANDPVASGIVPRVDRLGGNVTGFATSEISLAGKRLELLSEIAPGLQASRNHVRS